MEIKEKLTDFLNSNKKIRILIIIAFIGILLIMLSEMIPSNAIKTTKTNDIKQSYTDNLEKNTKRIISSISGVGKCEVMITIKATKETVYAQNSDVSSNDGNYSKKYEYVFYDGSNGDEPVLIKEYMPEIQGVAVVCEGGNNPEVAEAINAAISSLFNISSSKISISKLGWFYEKRCKEKGKTNFNRTRNQAKKSTKN